MSVSDARKVLLAVPGGIAAYKACEVLRGLQKAGCDVRVVMSADAERFVGTATFEALSKHPVADDLYGFSESPIPHIFLADWADLVLVVPATANVMAKMAAGIADDCLSTTLLAAHSPILVAAARPRDRAPPAGPATVTGSNAQEGRGADTPALLYAGPPSDGAVLCYFARL